MLSLLITFCMSQPSAPVDLRFSPDSFQSRKGDVGGSQVSYRASEGNIYVSKPVDVKYQTINIYVPEEYFSKGSVNGYTAETAPIFFPNSVGGYMPGPAASPGTGMDRMNNTILRALKNGYVVACPGARGRTLKGEDGRFTGKAPAGIVDLKAAVRYLKFNGKVIPGREDRIVTNGTSAGGAMSALLGATGNSIDYMDHLAAIGAAATTDNVWATSAYCPITNLENADAAYEWLLAGVNTAKSFRPQGPRPGGANQGATGTGPGAGQAGNPFGQPDSSAKVMTEDQIADSLALKALFPAYVQSLKLRDASGRMIELGQDGKGSLRDYLIETLLNSAKIAQKNGIDLSKTSWLTLKEGVPAAIDWDGYVSAVGRMKVTSAFDSRELSSGENNLFGSETINNRHFTNYGMQKSRIAGSEMAPASIIKMMNPMEYIGRSSASTARYWRIRHGANDRDTSIAIPALLALKLQNSGCKVDFALPWNTGHSGDYDLEELFAWIDSHAKAGS